MPDELALRRAQRAQRQDHGRQQAVLRLMEELTGKNYTVIDDRVVSTRRTARAAVTRRGLAVSLASR